jgi:hypothetical protein
LPCKKQLRYFSTIFPFLQGFEQNFLLPPLGILRKTLCQGLQRKMSAVLDEFFSAFGRDITQYVEILSRYSMSKSSVF